VIRVDGNASFGPLQRRHETPATPMNRGWAFWPIGRTPLGAGIHPPGLSWKREQANGVQHTKSYNPRKQAIQEKLKVRSPWGRARSWIPV